MQRLASNIKWLFVLRELRRGRNTSSSSPSVSRPASLNPLRCALPLSSALASGNLPHHLSSVRSMDALAWQGSANRSVVDSGLPVLNHPSMRSQHVCQPGMTADLIFAGMRSAGHDGSSFRACCGGLTYSPSFAPHWPFPYLLSPPQTCPRRRLIPPPSDAEHAPLLDGS